MASEHVAHKGSGGFWYHLGPLGEKKIDRSRIRTHATDVIDSLNQRLRPLGHSSLLYFETLSAYEMLL